MGSPKVRVVVTTQSGRKETTDWHAKGSPEAVEAMLNLIRSRADIVSLDWEETEEPEE